MPLSGVLEQLFDYWKSLPRREGSLLPSRHDLMPTDLRDVIPRLSLLKRQHRYQVNVSMMRTTYNTSWRSPFVGINSFDLTTPSMRENSAKLYEAILDQPSGALMTENILAKNGKQRCVHSLYLPLADSEGQSRYIVGCSAYQHKPCYENINERLLPAHDNVLDVEFLDIGAGQPSVTFEKIIREQRPTLSLHWWNRFLPEWGKHSDRPPVRTQMQSDHKISNKRHSSARHEEKDGSHRR